MSSDELRNGERQGTGGEGTAPVFEHGDVVEVDLPTPMRAIVRRVAGGRAAVLPCGAAVLPWGEAIEVHVPVSEIRPAQITAADFHAECRVRVLPDEPATEAFYARLVNDYWTEDAVNVRAGGATLPISVARSRVRLIASEKWFMAESIRAVRAAEAAQAASVKAGQAVYYGDDGNLTAEAEGEAAAGLEFGDVVEFAQPTRLRAIWLGKDGDDGWDRVVPCGAPDGRNVLRPPGRIRPAPIAEGDFCAERRVRVLSEDLTTTAWYGTLVNNCWTAETVGVSDGLRGNVPVQVLRSRVRLIAAEKWFMRESMRAGQAAAEAEVAAVVAEHARPCGEGEAAGAIRAACEEVQTMLLEKNRAYGNSAMDPLRIFSRADAVEQLNVRIDDKLSRIARGGEFAGDDTELDLIGYLVLKRAARRRAAETSEGTQDQ
jgi:hypothetical protein